jgi:hypothetical protein
LTKLADFYRRHSIFFLIRPCPREDALGISGFRAAGSSTEAFQHVALHLDGVFEMRVLFRMMGKVKTATTMRLALLSAKCKTLCVKRDDVGKRSGNQNLCLRRS